VAEHPTRQVLRIRPVRPFLAARILRSAASTLLAATVGWHVFELTGSTLALGALGVVQFLPVIPIGLLGGALADSRDRVALARRAILALALAAAGLSGAALAGASVEWVFLLVLVYSAGEALERPSSGAILPALVPTEIFAAAVNVVATGRNAAWALGPVIGGVCIAASGVAAAYALATALMFSSAALLRFVPPALPDRGAPAADDAVSLRAVREGIRFVVKSPPVLGSMTLDLFAVIFASVDALLPVFAKDVLGVGPLGFGLLSGALASGTFLMAGWMLVRPPGRAPGRSLLIAVGAFGGATLLFASSDVFALSLLALVIAGMADQVSMVARETILQLSTPDGLRGRVNAVNFVFIGASNELGRAESGALASLVGAVASVWWGGGLCLTALAAVGIGMPELGRFRIPRAEAETESSAGATPG
jgi:MFS family permease